MDKAKKMVRTRIAPSPTGVAHVGTAYTALFNYAFARKNNGQFILRLEDTDVKRNVAGAEEAIYAGLSWLGISWDEGPDLPAGRQVKSGQCGPYRQSERLETYKKYSEQLVKDGKAYEDEGAIRFKNPGEDVSWQDLVRGNVSFPGGEVTDFVIMKGDGYPTYNFAVVIDDIEMKITHVIRGEEHISNTPRQIALYQAFGVEPPYFAHLPTLRAPDRKKLSKRRDPVDLRLFRDEGYLPEALVNFLCLLGWSHPEEKEIFAIDEFVEHFNLQRVRSSGPIFDMNKLNWINKHYIMKMSQNEFVTHVSRASIYRGNPKFNDIARGTATLVEPRISTFSEYDSLVGFFFEPRKPKPGFFEKDYKKHLKGAIVILEQVKDWNKGEIDKSLLNIVDKNSFKTGSFFMNLRVAITGSRVTPPINESIVILGKEETLKRLQSILTK